MIQFLFIFSESPNVRRFFRFTAPDEFLYHADEALLYNVTLNIYMRLHNFLGGGYLV